MKKKILLAATSIVLVALATGCGRTGPSDTSSDIGSSGTSVIPKPAWKELFDAIEPFEGGLKKTEFFTKTSKITPKTSLATQRVTEDLYVEGVMGSMFGMENDMGHTNQDIDMTCKMYGANELIDCTRDSVTVKSTSTTPHVINGTQQMFAEANTVYTIIDDGTASTDIPDNYRVVQTKGATELISSYITFGLTTKTLSLMRYMLNSYYVSAEFNEATDKYYTVQENGLTKLNYFYYEEYEEPYDGQAQVVTFEVAFDANENVVSAKYVNEYLYREMEVFTQSGTYNFGYADNGAFAGEKLDPTKYYDKGTLLPTIENGAHHAKTDDYVSLLAEAVAGNITFKAPTNTYTESFLFENLETYIVEEEEVFVELYDNNVLVMLVQGATMDDEYIIGTQVTKDDTNVYQIIQGDPVKGDYKIVTPLTDVEDVDAIFDLRDYETIESFVGLVGEAKAGTNHYKITAGALNAEGVEVSAPGNELVTVTAQIAFQQSGNTIGSLITFEIGFEVLKDAGGAVTGVALIYSYVEELGQYDWMTYVQAYTYLEYNYDVMGVYEGLLDPKDYQETEE